MLYCSLADREIFDFASNSIRPVPGKRSYRTNPSGFEISMRVILTNVQICCFRSDCQYAKVRIRRSWFFAGFAQSNSRQIQLFKWLPVCIPLALSICSDSELFAFFRATITGVGFREMWIWVCHYNP